MGSVCGGTCGLPASRGEIVERDLRNSLQLAFRTLIRTTVCGLRARPGTLFFEHEAQIERAGCVTSPISPTIRRSRVGEPSLFFEQYAEGGRCGGMSTLVGAHIGQDRLVQIALFVEQNAEV